MEINIWRWSEWYGSIRLWEYRLWCYWLDIEVSLGTGVIDSWNKLDLRKSTGRIYIAIS